MERNDLPEQQALAPAPAPPVDVVREDLHVEEREVVERPEVDLGPAAFEEGTIRLPVRGEEVVINRRVVLAREVVVWKDRTVDRQDVSTTAHQGRVDTESPIDRE